MFCVNKISYVVLLYQEWEDEYLRWDVDQFDGLSMLILNPEDIWIPDIMLINTLVYIYIYTYIYQTLAHRKGQNILFTGVLRV